MTLPIVKAVRVDVEMAMEENNYPRPLTTSFKKWDDLLPYSRRLALSWVEIDVEGGGTDNDNFGTPSCLSDNGITLAVGAVNSDPSGQDSGSVHIYKRDSNGSFTQPGPNIPGTSLGGLFGWAVSLSDNGSVLAVGAPREGGVGTVRLYKDKGVQYEVFPTPLPPLPPIMSGTTGGDNFGYSVSLSGNGGLLAVGAPGGRYVKVYDVNPGAGSSTPFPLLVVPSPTIAGFGYSVSLSDNGDFLGIGARDIAIPPSTFRKVQIYERKGATFVAMPNPSCTFQNGEAVTFAGKSDIFAVRDPVAGGVRVYEIDGGRCTEIHSGIVPIDPTANYGPLSLPPRNELLFSLNADGKVLAIADTPNFGGKVWVYDLGPPTNGQTKGEYKRRGSFINVPESTSVSLADTGDLVAIGTRFRVGAGGREDDGFTYVYEWKLQTSAPTPTPTPVSSSYKYNINFSVKNATVSSCDTLTVCYCNHDLTFAHFL